MALKIFHLSAFVFLIFLVFSATGHSNRNLPSNEKPSAFDFIKQLQGYQKGNKSEKIHQLKNYLRKFGYLDHNHQANRDDYFDNDLESAIKTYQRNFRINPTGKLDARTVSMMTTPRCGVPDIVNGTNHMARYPNGESRDSSSNYIVSHYAFFNGKPRWPPPKTHLTYKFLSGFPNAATAPVRGAFQKWASAVQYFTFSEVEIDEDSDLTVGYYWGQDIHGDVDGTFDESSREVAHSYPPTDGRFHCNGNLRWSVGPIEKFFHIETVAMHEIGHLLGLQHSSQENSIMQPTIPPGIIKDFHPDDIQGIKALYNIP